jgi:hypothetical protein
LTCSSEASTQSSWPSQRHLDGIHRPFAHWNSSLEQVFGAAMTQVNEPLEFIIEQVFGAAMTQVNEPLEFINQFPNRQIPVGPHKP